MYFNHLYFKYDNQFGTPPIVPVHPASFSRHHHHQIFCLCHLLSPFFSLYFFFLILDPSGASLHAQSFKQNQNAVDFQKISEVSQIVFQQEMKLSRTFHTYKWASKQSLSRQRRGRKPDSSATKALRSLCGVTKGLEINKVFCTVCSFPTISLFLPSVLIHRAAATKLFK